MSHATHCCVQHGCKYGDPNCPVATKKEPQVYACEICDWEKGNAEFLEIAYLMNQVETLKAYAEALAKDMEGSHKLWNAPSLLTYRAAHPRTP